MVGSNDRDRRATLERTPLFAGLNPEQLSEFARVAHETSAPAGSMIFEQGDAGDGFYIIRSGKVQVFRRGERGIETQLSILGPRESFGEMALLTGNSRSACVRAMEETHLIVLSKNEFDRILKDHPDASLSFVKQISEWLLRDEAHLQQATERIMHPSRISWSDFAFIAGVVLLCGLIFNTANPSGIRWIPKVYSHESISFVAAAEAIAARAEGAVIVDARPSNFYEERHIEGAISLPLPVFDFVYMMKFGEMRKNKPIIVYGRNISRRYDSEVAYRLVLRGHRDVSILENGVFAWEKQEDAMEAQENSES